jgi:uncharacterized protein
MELTVAVVAVAVLATLVGAVIQGSIGFGMNLVTVPVLALVLPEALPVVVILLGVPISVSMLRHEHQATDLAGLGWIVVGRLPGSALGAWVVVAVSVPQLQRAVGAVVLVFVVATVVVPPIPVLPATQTIAGVVSGITGTAAGIGGPPVALLYQRHPGPSMRSTLAASFFVGTFLSFGVLAVTGVVRWDQIALALLLAPIVVLGTRLGRRSHALLDRGWLRPAVLGFSALSAVVVIVDSLG